MRSISIIFKNASHDEVRENFNTRFTAMDDGWMLDQSIYIRFYDEIETELTLDAKALIRQASGKQKIIAVIVEVSGRIPGDKEIISLCEDTLSAFEGWADDDYSDHLWTLEEIRSNALHDGHPFFDYNGWHKAGLKSAKSNIPL